METTWMQVSIHIHNYQYHQHHHHLHFHLHDGHVPEFLRTWASSEPGCPIWAPESGFEVEAEPRLGFIHQVCGHEVFKYGGPPLVVMELFGDLYFNRRWGWWYYHSAGDGDDQDFVVGYSDQLFQLGAVHILRNTWWGGGGRPDLLQYYIGGVLPNLLQYYIGGVFKFYYNITVLKGKWKVIILFQL